MMLSKFSRIPAKGAVFQKEFVARVASRWTPVFLIAEYPKCGGTWLKFMLAEMLQVPAWTKGAPATGSCVMQAHWLKNKGRCIPIVLHRDIRDVMVSFYYHSFFQNEFQNESWVQYMREKFAFADFGDIKNNLLPFMIDVIDSPQSPSFSWITFENSWEDSRISTKYEDLRLHTPRELKRLSGLLLPQEISLERGREISEKYSIENMRKIKSDLNPRVTGMQNAQLSFIRKGSVGGWSDSFSDESLQWLESKASQKLLALGYKLGRPEKAEVT